LRLAGNTPLSREPLELGAKEGGRRWVGFLSWEFGLGDIYRGHVAFLVLTWLQRGISARRLLPV
jgi:hypothetical protein